jgi:hypothetical protein
MYRGFAALAVMLATIGGAACDNGPTPTTPTPGTPTTEAFAGSLTLNGSRTHSFSAGAAGDVTATVTSLTPSDQVIGFQLGTWDTVTCSAVKSNDLATVNSVLTGSTQSAASLCVRVHDPNGVLKDLSVDYVITVSHQP